MAVERPTIKKRAGGTGTGYSLNVVSLRFTGATADPLQLLASQDDGAGGVEFIPVNVDDLHLGGGGDVATSDATWTTILTLSPSASTALVLRGTVAAIKSDATKAGGWDFTVRVRRPSSGGPVTGTATFVLAEHDGTGWDVRVQASGATVVVQVHGEAATSIAWRAEVQATEARSA